MCVCGWPEQISESTGGKQAATATSYQELQLSRDLNIYMSIFCIRYLLSKLMESILSENRIILL